MGTRPLTSAAETAVNGYLTALLPASEIGDARHDVIADVRYWGDSGLVPVLRIAHGVVTQRAKVSDEAAVQVLADELGLDDPTIAEILGLGTDEIAAVRQRVAAALTDDPAGTNRGRWGGPAAAPPIDDVGPGPDVDDTRVPDREAVADDPIADTADEPMLRIGFDEDEPLPSHLLEEPRRRWSNGRILAIAVVVWLVVAVVLLTQR